jgi:alkaline phosphatase
LTKYEFLLTVGQQKSYYSFDQGGWHFVVLDACFNTDGTAYERRNSSWDNANIPAAELDWLKQDLDQNQRPTIVFVHQRLDNSPPHSIKNAADVRQVLSGHDIAAVFQGHSHKNDYQEIAGIHYVTLVAMIEGSGAENNGYSRLELMDDGSLRVVGFRKQQNRQWETATDKGTEPG